MPSFHGCPRRRNIRSISKFSTFHVLSKILRFNMGFNKGYFRNSRPGHKADGVAEMPMKRYKSAARCLCPTRREPRANMRDLNLLNQAWPNAVFGLRPRLFFLLIPYIHIFVLHRRFYERERPYHLRASDLRGNGTDPGNDPVYPHALRCLPL